MKKEKFTESKKQSAPLQFKFLNFQKGQRDSTIQLFAIKKRIYSKLWIKNQKKLRSAHKKGLPILAKTIKQRHLRARLKVLKAAKKQRP